ncbi:hypothetical protein LSAT2_002499 [Lamellibrachia satsuma]|nr:hypothetical protein LSAT2_002499 [Lamellibrachia satsuma]
MFDTTMAGSPCVQQAVAPQRGAWVIEAREPLNEVNVMRTKAAVLIVACLLCAFAMLSDVVDGFKLMKRGENHRDTAVSVRRKRFIFVDESFHWFTDMCKFPFWFRGRMYWSCIKEDSLYLWCATTSDYDNDGMWRWCWSVTG